MEEIKESFRPYFQETEIEEPTDPNQLYTLQQRIEGFHIIRAQEVDEFAAVYFKPAANQTKRDHGQLNKWIDPAVQRYKDEFRDDSTGVDDEQYTEDGEEFKSNLQCFVRLYGFLSQIIDWQDVELEKLYAYGRYLLTKLPRRGSDGEINLDDEVVLTAYRNEKTFDGSGSLKVNETTPVYGPTEVGTGGTYENRTSPLSAVIKIINERFSTDFTEDDKLLFDQISGDMAKDSKLAEQARAGSKDKFKVVFEPKVIEAFVNRQGRNEKIVNDFMSNGDMRNLIIAALLDDVYERSQVR
jgi:type I restriction enzyme R subunit